MSPTDNHPLESEGDPPEKVSRRVLSSEEGPMTSLHHPSPTSCVLCLTSLRKLSLVSTYGRGDSVRKPVYVARVMLLHLWFFGPSNPR